MAQPPSVSEKHLSLKHTFLLQEGGSVVTEPQEHRSWSSRGCLNMVGSSTRPGSISQKVSLHFGVLCFTLPQNSPLHSSNTSMDTTDRLFSLLPQSVAPPSPCSLHTGPGALLPQPHRPSGGHPPGDTVTQGHRAHRHPHRSEPQGPHASIEGLGRERRDSKPSAKITSRVNLAQSSGPLHP